jgi:hypothetical protein
MIWKQQQINFTRIPARNNSKIQQTFYRIVTLIKNDTFPLFSASCSKMYKSRKTDPLGLAGERGGSYRLIPPNS